MRKLAEILFLNRTYPALMMYLYSFLTAVLRGGCRHGSLLCAALLCTLLPTGAVFAQQNAGLGTASPHASALLDMTSTTQGLLVPRMSTLQRTNIIAPANGLLVFDTDVSRFYFYNTATTSWISVPILADVPTGGTGATWSLTGNAGLNAASQFLGTTDAQPLVFRTSNSTRATILADGNIGIGTTTPQSALEISSAGSGLRFTNLTTSTPTTTGTGKVLSVNTQGDVVLVDDAQGTGALPVGAPAGSTLRYNGTNWVTSSTLINSGTQIGINTTPSRTLDVNGNARIGANGTTITNIIKATGTITATNFILPENSTTLTFTVTGAALGSSVIISPSSGMANGLVIAYSRVSAANTVEIRISNILSSVAITLPAMDYYITVIE